MAQGVGSLLCGLAGGLPVTGVIVRSSANVLAGGRTRASTILHGVWLLLFVAMLPQILRLVPVASVAAVVVYTGYQRMRPKAVRELWPSSKSEVAIYVAIPGAVVFVDLLTDVLNSG